MPTSDRDDDDDDRPRRRRPRDVDDEDTDDRPSRRRRDADDDDEDDRPSRRRRDYDERDDFDDLPPRRRGGDGLGITSMILGIVSCVTALGGLCCILFPGISLLTGIVAVILGFVGRSQRPESGTAKAGIITGFAGIGLSILLVVVGILLHIGMNN